MLFEWVRNRKKHISKHGLDFSTAHSFSVTKIVWNGSMNSIQTTKTGYITIGEINGIAVVLMVVYTERGDAIRLISARKATKHERRMYYGAQGN